MKRLFPILAILLVALAWASPGNTYQLHVRDDDPGGMRAVENITADTVVDFGTMLQLQTTLDTEFGTVEWGANLEGLVESCFVAPNAEQGANGAVNRGVPDGAPTFPLTVKPKRDDGGFIYQYPQPGDNRASYSYRGCPVLADFNRDCNGPGNCAGRGGSSWVVKFDTPRTAMCFEMHLDEFSRSETGSAGERIHMEFWGEDGSKVGHQDILDSQAVEPPNETFCWESLTPVAALSSWPQNQNGFGFIRILLGESSDTPPPPPELKTIEERLLDVENCLNAQVDFGCPIELGE